MGCVFTKNPRSPQPQCNPTPLATEGPGKRQHFSSACLTVRKPNKQVVPSIDMSETQSHLDGDGRFWKEPSRTGGIMFQSNNQQIIMTLLME